MTVKTMTPAALKARLDEERELALLDVREQGAFGTYHLLSAVNISLSHLELKMADFVPHKATEIVLVDGGDGDDLAARAAERLTGFGYTDVAVLEGGTKGWEDAGFEVFSGVNVPTKAFGEFVEHTYDTPRIKPEVLKQMMDAGENMVVLDSRPMSEYRVMNIPMGVDVPGAELAYRVHDMAPDPETTVVVNCAGRTRSIIGAQSLINAGIPNKVVALENGTMGWHLAGFELERGNERQFAELSDQGRAKAFQVKDRVTQRFGVKTCTVGQLNAWKGETDRTTYVLDVRNPDEFLEGHIAGSRYAPGGQLVQAWDRYIAVRGARLVLVDDDGVRATMTAHWMLQMDWEVYVLEGGIHGHDLVSGPHQPEVLGDVPAVSTISAVALAAGLEAGTHHVVDFADSITYRAGHIPGAWFAVRARIPGNLDALSKGGTLVFTSPDGVLAALAAGDLDRDVVVLEGGTAAWTGQMEEGFNQMADKHDDVWYRPYDLDDAQEGAMKQYLSWEIGLIDQIDRDGTQTFHAFT